MYIDINERIIWIVTKDGHYTAKYTYCVAWFLLLTVTKQKKTEKRKKRDKVGKGSSPTTVE